MRANPFLPAFHPLLAFALACAAALTAAPCAAQQATVSSPGGPTPVLVAPQFMALPPPVATNSATATSISNMTVVTRRTFDSTTLVPNTTTLAATSAPPSPPIYAVGTVNPAAGTLQSTIGTIETGTASSRPAAGVVAGMPLNMAPEGVALNSDLSGGPVYASYTPPSTQVLGAPPESRAMAPAANAAPRAAQPAAAAATRSTRGGTARSARADRN